MNGREYSAKVRVMVVVAGIFVASLALGACQQVTELSAATTKEERAKQEAEDNRIIYYGASTIGYPELDPQKAADSVSIDYIENLFVTLTNADLENNSIIPEAATSWEISEDGLIYVFYLREDIPWVFHNPITGETRQVLDPEGKPRFVIAQDFVNSIFRICSPELAQSYSSNIGPLISGCQDLLFSEGSEGLTSEDYEIVGARALDENTLEIRLAFPASYFLSMTSMWTLAAIPQWAIDEHGDSWTSASSIVSSGPFVLNEWIPNIRVAALRNPLFPPDMAGDGNIDAFEIDIVPNLETIYQLWQAGLVDQSGIPSKEIVEHLESFPNETDQIEDLNVFYIAFAHDKEPFDDKNVRAAFSAALDRQAFIDTVAQGQGVPMQHFAPPGIAFAPQIDEVGVGFDPVFAASKLAEAGYPDCQGFPAVTLMGYQGEFARDWIEFVRNNWFEVLGCDPETIQVEQLSLNDLLVSLANSDKAQRPHMWTLGWFPDYADENNWVGDVLWCENNNQFLRPCTQVDDWIVQARMSSDSSERSQLYRMIEEAFFGEEGEFPLAPIYLRIQYVARHEWLNRTPALFGGDQWWTWQIDTQMRTESNR